MRADGHEVEVTARDFAQTLELCERFGIEHTAIGRHRGERLASKGRGPGAPERGAHALGAGRRFDVAMGHGSNDVSVAAALLRIPAATAFDYEFAAAQHHVNCRLCRVVMVPDAIPPERLAPYGAKPAKLRRYAGLKEEYYLADFEPSEAVLASSGSIASGRSWWCGRRRRCRSTTASRTRCSGRCSSGSRARTAQTVVLPRTAEQRDEVRRLGPFVVPEHAVDAQSLVAYADLVISAGGTMNREAVALGTPVYTTFEGRLGAVDERAAGARGGCAGSPMRPRCASSGASGTASCGSGETRANSSHFSSRPRTS